MISDNEKGNRYHDEKGRFASGSGNKAATSKDIGSDERMFYEEKIQRALKGVMSKLETYRDKDEGTYDFVTGEPVDLSDGYMVTFHQNEADENGHYKSHFGKYTPEEYDKLAFEFARDNDAIVYIGVYDNEPEISFKVKTKVQARELAEKYNQDSYWDNEKGKLRMNRKRDKAQNPMQGE